MLTLRQTRVTNMSTHSYFYLRLLNVADAYWDLLATFPSLVRVVISAAA